MNRIAKISFFVLVLTASAVAQVSITSLSKISAERSSRVLIQGSGFGTLRGSGHVNIGGIAAPLTRWSDTLISAYVPETAATGTVNVQVFNGQGFASNTMPLGVTLRANQGPHIRWRFQADADYIQARPAVAADGTVYVIDVYGHLYALAPGGGLKWVFNASSSGFGNVSVGADGTIYTGSTTIIYALAPDGTLKWQFNQNPAAFILLGPNVGPDGNIYAVGTQGMGVFSLTPAGALRWFTPENYSRPIVTLQEIVFGPSPQSRLYFHANDHLRGLALDGTSVFTFVDHLDTSQGLQQPAVALDGSVYSNLFTYPGPGIVLGKFDSNGNQLWYTFDRFITSTNAVSTPDVGVDGVVYDGRNLNTLYALNPDSTVRWTYTDSEPLFSPIVSPLNDLVLVDGASNGHPGFFEAVNTTGALLWKIGLPIENGLNVDPAPLARARFTPDGQTAYIGTSIAGQSSDGYSYLYSLQTGSSSGVTLSSFTVAPVNVIGGKNSKGTVTLSGPAPSSGATIKLASSNSAIAAVPVVTIAAGATSKTFAIKTIAVTAPTPVSITASYAGGTLYATLTVKPPALSLLTVNPTTVQGGSSSQGTVKLSGPAPAGGVQIKLSSNNVGIAAVPPSVTITSGSTVATFNVQTKAVTTTDTVVVSAVAGSITRKVTLIVTP